MSTVEELNEEMRDVTGNVDVGENTVDTTQPETAIIEGDAGIAPENLNRYRGVRDNCVPEKNACTLLQRNSVTDSTDAMDSSGATSSGSSPESDTAVAAATDASDKQASVVITRKEGLVSIKDTTVFKPELLSIPLDSLHYVASFLTPSDWCNGFGLINRTAHAQSREIVRRVRMHAFKCASEVVCAWKVGQWEDARELAALYVEAGVPIYSRCLGHSFHTLNWRMKVEATEIRSKQNSAETTAPDNSEAKTTCDAFFGSSRTEFRSMEGHGRALSYLEEKCLFWLDRESPTPRVTGSASHSSRRNIGTHNEDGVQRRSVSPPPQHVGRIQRKIPMVIHQHLLDRHNVGEYYVNDRDGRMITPMTVLSADFFHPSARKRRKSVDACADTSLEISHSIGSAGVTAEESGWLSDDELLNPPHPPSPSSSGDIAEIEEHAPKSVLSSVLLEAYSSTVASSLDCLENVQEIQRHLRTRFATYHRRLESFLVKDDTCGFEECILDFWDEFFPHSAGIHYHDLHTPVPRMSCMNKFLTTPCPKAIGVVQCEIERLRITTRGKGVNVKGRFFPTYEYRLFIRNRPLHPVIEPELEEQSNFVRRDTVLMVAKNRGRKHAEPSGVIPLSAASKKGSNNYYLYVPQQMDVDDHFTTCNEHLSKQARLEPNGASRNPVLVSEAAESVLLGRLQSNFIGTEFQIFTPRLRKLPRSKPEPTTSHPFGSDDEYDDDSGVSSDTARRYRFGRFLRTTGTNPGSDSGSVGQLSAMDRPRVTRTTSAPEFLGRQPRTNRRAIANDALSSSQPHSALCEEEGGAITYTANLLGSRPRIMDVCIPKVTIGGLSGAEWKRYLESCDDTDDCRMLSCFRQLQQRRENHEQLHGGQDGGADDESDAGDESDFGLMALQNRPPWWNADLGSFVLNFGGRVSVASVKNFQLCERTNQDLIMLQFGRIKGRHSFTMDFQHPLTAVQAFSIAISSLQSKISFG